MFVGADEEALERSGQENVWSLRPSWPPDGQRIAYAATSSGQTQIWAMNADGSDQRQLTAGLGPMNSDDPHWPPDGTTIIFGMGQSENRAMYIVPSEGGEPELFATGVHWRDWQPGRKIK